MNSEIRDDVTMSVSPVLKDGKLADVYVLFSCTGKSAEFKLHDAVLVKNSGFTDPEIDKIKEYMGSERESIEKLAKQVDPMKAFLNT